MKGKNLPMSALITGLLAAPLMGMAPPVSGEAQQRAPMVRAEVFPTAMPGELAERMRRIARGEKLDAHGMQGLQGRMGLEMRARLAGIKKSGEDKASDS
jgi:hypothetical protein